MDYELSYPRQHHGFFRLRDTDNEYLFKFIEGRFKPIGSDNQLGTLKIRTNLVSDGDLATLTWDEEVVIPSGAIKMEGPDFWRLCYSRGDDDWRVLNEITFKTRCHTFKYAGVIRVDWWDRSPHLYHYGEAYQLLDGEVLFVPSESLVAPERTRRVEALMDRVQKLYAMGR